MFQWIQSIKCMFGFHDKEYHESREILEYYKVTVTCKNKKCDWEDSHSRHFSE